MKSLLVVWIFLIFPAILTAKIRILTFHYNRPDFLEYQCQAFKKFFPDEYEIIVFNDAPDSKMQKEIEEACEKNGITCVRFEQSWHETDPLNEMIRNLLDTPQKNSFFRFPLKNGFPSHEAIAQQVSVRHCHVIQYALDHYGYGHDDVVVILDADVFPIKPISIRSLLKDVQLVAIDSEFKHIHYAWVPFVAFDPRKLPDLADLKFHVDVIDEVLCDTGSHSYHYLKNHPEVTCRLFPRRSDSEFYPWDPLVFLNAGFDHPFELSAIGWLISIEFYIDDHFVHFCGGSGLHPEKKWQVFHRFMNCILN